MIRRKVATSGPDPAGSACLGWLILVFLVLASCGGSPEPAEVTESSESSIPTTDTDCSPAPPEGAADAVGVTEVDGHGVGTPTQVVDIDGDGSPEVVLSGFGNTARMAAILHWDGCGFVPVVDGDHQPFMVLVGIGGGSCRPTGCGVTNQCVESAEAGRVLQHQVASPIETDPGVFEIRWELTEYRQVKGVMQRTLTQSVTVADETELPVDGPSLSGVGSDVIDC